MAKPNNTIQTPKEKKQLPDKLLMALVSILAAFPPLSTDLYLPALPEMSKELHSSVALMNMSLIVFFIMISVSSIIWGPIFGRMIYGGIRLKIM